MRREGEEEREDRRRRGKVTNAKQFVWFYEI
jgi:hypothetical protein